MYTHVIYIYIDTYVYIEIIIFMYVCLNPVMQRFVPSFSGHLVAGAMYQSARPDPRGEFGCIVQM